MSCEITKSGDCRQGSPCVASARSSHNTATLQPHPTRHLACSSIERKEKEVS